MNNVSLLGRVCKDIELKQTQSGTAVVSFTIAVNRRFVKEGQPNADFINCVAWRGTAEFIAKYFGKGKMIGIVGSLQTGKYDKDGQTHYTTDVIVDEAYFAGDKKDESNGQVANDNSFDGFLPMPNDDDLPF